MPSTGLKRPWGWSSPPTSSQFSFVPVVVSSSSWQQRLAVQIATITTSGDDVMESGKPCQGVWFCLPSSNAPWTWNDLSGNLQIDTEQLFVCHLFSFVLRRNFLFFHGVQLKRITSRFAQLFVAACCLFLPFARVCCASSVALQDTQVHVEAQSLTPCLDCSHHDSAGFLHLWEFS